MFSRPAASPIVGRDLHAISADRHTAPAARVILRRVIEVEDTARVLALENQREVAVTQQIARGLGHRHEQMDGLSGPKQQPALESVARSDERDIDGVVAEDSVDLVERID
jgi:hypothetical protein